MTIADVRAALATIEAALPKLRNGAPDLERRARIRSQPDGYPRRSSGAQPSGTTRPAPIDGDTGEPTSTLDYSDPTPDAALTVHRPDSVNRGWATFERQINRAADAIKIALSQCIVPQAVEDTADWCAACATVNHDTDPDGKVRPYLTPADPRIKGPSDVNGRLREAMALCRWHRDYVEHNHLAGARLSALAALPPKAMTVEYVTRGRTSRMRAS